ncbi:hypothetical protein BDV96DRAFT_188696 [Lophiotrema nucula]|uniref:Lysine-specific metallo-endopeptidase domain-containing protein n=1 Tax=Lophiotrema nucula TaxID=690887 RepID=A0A6A5YW39_9PLEO|nr:hypothetical protein BDV96DRAFT_188696 [Lophiotrema nucula]
MLSRSLQIFFTLTCLSLPLYCYTIDNDCGVDRDFVQQGADDAFALAATAVAELTRNPINPAIDVIFQKLFGQTVANRITNKDLLEVNLMKLATISQLDGAIGQADTDVRFYCTTKRIEKRDDGQYYNKDTDYVYPESEITSRWASCFDLIEPTLAITTNPDRGPSEIQICPWYLSKARGVKFRDFKSINAITWGALARVSMPLVSSFFYTPIDAFHLFDKVLLHELTHTYQFGRAIDMGNPGSPYGWKNCKGLANIFMATGGTDNNLDPQWNSDSIALLCSAIQLTVNGITVQDDGKLNPPQRNRKRDVVMYPVTWVA